MSAPNNIVDWVVLIGTPAGVIATIWVAYFFSYAQPRKNERREYGLKLERVYRGIEQHGYKIFSEKFDLISEYAHLAREISTKRLLGKEHLCTLTQDSQKLASVAHSVEIQESLKTRSVSLYLSRLKPLVDELKK